MYPINGLYTYPPVGGYAQFGPANPGAGIPNGTQITYSFLNDVQGELLNILSAGGVAPAQNTPTQVKQALDVLYKSVGGSAGNSATSVGSLTITTEFTPAVNCLIQLTGSFGANVAPAALNLTFSGATVIRQSAHYSAATGGVLNAGNFIALLQGSAGVALTMTAQVVLAGTGNVDAGMIYVASPR